MPLLLLGLILAGSFLVKLPFLSSPLLGYFGSYQIVNAMMAQMMLRDKLASFLIPQATILLEGKPALHLLYYPFAALAAAVAKFLFGGSLDFWGRAQASVFVLLAAILLYQIVLKIFNRKSVALSAAFIFSFSPMILIEGISFQNEAAGVFFLVLAAWLLLRQTLPAVFLSGIVFSLALTARLHFILIFPAFLLALLLLRVSWIKILLFLAASAVPLTAWYGHTYFLGQGSDHVMTSLFLQMGDGRLGNVNWFFKIEFYERLFEILTGPWIGVLFLPFLVLGVLDINREKLPFILWLAGSLATAVILPQKVFDHPFYLIGGVPAAAVLSAVSLDPFIRRFRKPVAVFFLGAAFLVSMRYFLPPAASARLEDQEVLTFAEEVKQFSAPGDRIIAQHGSSPDLLYYSGRQGWPFNLQMTESRERPGFYQRMVARGYGTPMTMLEYLKTQGARYLIISQPEKFYAQPEFADYLKQRYPQKTMPHSTLLVFELEKTI